MNRNLKLRTESLEQNLIGPFHRLHVSSRLQTAYRNIPASKRVFDIFFSIIGLYFLSPLFMILAVMIRLTSPGPILYQGVRVGKHGHLFKQYKFRTMIVDADLLGSSVTTAADPRITPIGHFLRDTKIDELPQLFNVLRGDMSLVGPRPEAPPYVELYTTEQRRVLNVKPGITSLASIKYRNSDEELSDEDAEAKYINEIMPGKLALDLKYLEHSSVWQDTLIILRTICAVLADLSILLLKK